MRCTSRNLLTETSTTLLFWKPTGVHLELFYLLRTVSFSFQLDEMAQHKVIISVWSVSMHVLSSRNLSARDQTLLHFLCSHRLSSNSQRGGVYLGKFFQEHYTKRFSWFDKLIKSKTQPLDLAWKSQKWSHLLAICTSCWEQQTSMRNSELTFSPNVDQLK